MTSDDKSISNNDKEFEISYRLIIKIAEESLLSAKWFKEYDTLVSTDYNIVFKTSKETSTQLADIQNFIKFKAESI
ncbi:25804_t:CDS:2, partial [Racocetra persica]